MKEETFEKSIERQEKIVKKLESSELSLEESVKTFEEGIRLAQTCHKTLDEAEKKVEILLSAQDGSFTKQAFQPDKTNQATA